MGDFNLLKPGEEWYDMDGKLIQAHGGGILYDNGIYYWYGENKDTETFKQGRFMRTDVIGVSCYSSRDLINWKNEGVVLPAVGDPNHDLYTGKVVERPKVIYNKSTKKYVMWMHIDSADYQYARAGVAVSENPTGPFEYIGSVRPNNAMSRDMTLFQDEDGKAYLIYSSESNFTMHISLLTGDYLEHTGIFTRNFIQRKREAPAVFKDKGKYYIITSGCSGWAPNQAEYAVADSPLGPWETMGNPCIGTDSDITFHAQSTHVFKLEDGSDRFVFMADRWNSQDLRNSRYIWLPIDIHDHRIVIKWQD